MSRLTVAERIASLLPQGRVWQSPPDREGRSRVRIYSGKRNAYVSVIAGGSKLLAGDRYQDIAHLLALAGVISGVHSLDVCPAWLSTIDEVAP